MLSPHFISLNILFEHAKIMNELAQTLKFHTIQNLVISRTTLFPLVQGKKKIFYSQPHFKSSITSIIYRTFTNGGQT